VSQTHNYIYMGDAAGVKSSLMCYLI